MSVGLDDFYAAVRVGLTEDRATGRQALWDLLCRSGGTTWLRAQLHAMIAQHDAGSDQTSALWHLRQAVDLGWNDCITASSEGFARLADSMEFIAIHCRMAYSPADLEELAWLHRERKHVLSEMLTITAENIGRKDVRATEIPQCPIPSRATSSVGVLGSRAFLAAVQAWEREFISVEDIKRHGHLAAINLISSRDYSYADELHHEAQAKEQAGARRLAVARRSFRPTPGLSVIPEPVLALKLRRGLGQPDGS